MVQGAAIASPPTSSVVNHMRLIMGTSMGGLLHTWLWGENVILISWTR
jgi:hypothetical protein